jgi:segregation and condensation protein A
MQLQSFSQFETMVSKPTWKDILLDLIASERIDPWNIDILEVADAFIQRVRQIERMDFVLQANVILAASILLKYKSNYLKMLDYQAEITDFLPGEEVLQETGTVEEVPQLTLSSRIPPKRQITLDELIDEMERIIKYEDVERVRIPRGSIVETVDLELHQHDIERDMEQILDRVRENTDSEGWSMFSRITEGHNLQGIVYTLMCLLHLVQMNTVDIRQDEMFGEIFVYLIEKEKD